MCSGMVQTPPGSWCVSSQQVVSGRCEKLQHSGSLQSFQLGAGRGLLGSLPARVFVCLFNQKCQLITAVLGGKKGSRLTAGKF